MRPKRHDISPVGILPHVKVFQNGFLGEMVDAAKAGLFYREIDFCVSFSLAADG